MWGNDVAGNGLTGKVRGCGREVVDERFHSRCCGGWLFCCWWGSGGRVPFCLPLDVDVSVRQGEGEGRGEVCDIVWYRKVLLCSA